ncbi:MAG: 23S rRNA (pseudouridine(1915)-N(3))-methyltransferase RlmH [Pseudomonadota bacterium]
MEKIRAKIIAFGKLQGPEEELVKHYHARLGDQIRMIELAGSKHATALGRKQDECMRLQKHIKKNDVLITLSEQGLQMKTTELARFISHLTVQSNVPVFVIGGADGFADDVYRKAKKNIAFGRQTWPHRLVRVMLFEQLYRISDLLRGGPYHRA